MATTPSGKMDMDFPIEYRGYRIYQATGQSVAHHNSVSGHHWTTPTFKDAFNVVGPGTGSAREDFKTIEKAQAQIDFIIQYPPAHAQEAVAKILAIEAEIAAQASDESDPDSDDTGSAPGY